MRTLEDGHSEELLKHVLKHKNLSMFEDSLKLIVNKCDGHPLALYSMAQYICWENLSSQKKTSAIFGTVFVIK